MADPSSVGLKLPGTGMNDPLLQMMMRQGEEMKGKISEFKKSAGERYKAIDETNRTATERQQKAIDEYSTLAKDAPKVGEEKPMPALDTARIKPEQMNETLALVTALAALGGAITRQPLTAALNNFAAGVHGYVQGNQLVFQQNLKEFEANIRKAHYENESVWRKYQAANEKHKTDLNAKHQEYMMIAAEAGRTTQLELMKLGRDMDALKLEEMTFNHSGKMMEGAIRIREAAQARAATAEIQRGNAAERAQHNREMEDIARGRESRLGGRGVSASSIDVKNVKEIIDADERFVKMDDKERKAMSQYVAAQAKAAVVRKEADDFGTGVDDAIEALISSGKLKPGEKRPWYQPDVGASFKPVAPAAARATMGDVPDIKAKVEAAGWPYEPDVYSYRLAPDGTVQRKKGN